ncbi:MAG: zinc-ribbon domain containing protein [Gammaproteobacteria bacterium]
MTKHHNTGRNPSERELREAERVLQLSPEQQKAHPAAIAADHDKLKHINTYGALPDFYLDRPFIYRKCGKREIWKARDQKWYYEEARGHIDATAVECHACRKAQ